MTEKKPSMPWYVSAGGEIQGQFRSEAATYRHVKDLVGLGRDCEVWHWDKRDGWVLYERIEATS